jgi:hypothetical protein
MISIKFYLRQKCFADIFAEFTDKFEVWCIILYLKPPVIAGVMIGVGCLTIKGLVCAIINVLTALATAIYFIIRLIGRANAIRPYTNKVSLRRLKKFKERRRVLSVQIAVSTARSSLPMVK